MKHMKIWFIDFFTEAHRKPGEGDVLAEELAKLGIECSRDPTSDCSFVFCGSIWKMWQCIEGCKSYPSIPVIHYNWDLYPFQVMERPDYVRANPDLWDPYLIQLQDCRDIWVPSQCTVDRTTEFTGRSDSYVIKTSVRPWDFDWPTKGDYALDIMRKYPDYNRDLARQGCDSVSMPLIETLTELDWEEFKSRVAHSAFLISAQFEASTGGLSLLEGYWHGKPCLLSNSPRHGGVDYFGDRASYFQWDNAKLFQMAVVQMRDNPPEIDVDEARRWIVKNYSERAMAKRMAKRLWELYAQSN